MAHNSFNAQNGFSVGIPAVQVIDGQGNFVNNASSSSFGNVTANNLTTNTITGTQATVGNITANGISVTNAIVGTETATTIIAGALTSNTVAVTGSATISGNLTVDTQINTSTPLNPFIANSMVATSAYMHSVIDWEESATPLYNLTGGLYNFACAGSGLRVSFTANAGIVTAVTSITNGGTQYYTGDLIAITGGNYDTILRVTSQTGGSVTGLEILFGGSLYTSQTNNETFVADPISATYLLYGILTSDATIVMPAGTHTEHAGQWNLINNTTGNFDVTVKLTNGLGGTIGNGVTVIRGTQNSRITLALTDGITDIYSVNGQTYLAYTDVTNADPDALIANFNPPFFELTDGLTVGIGAQHVNLTATPTLTVDGLGPYPIMKGPNVQVLPGDIGGANHEMMLTFNLGTGNWILQNPFYGVATTGIQSRDADDYQYFTVANIAGTFISRENPTIENPRGEIVYQSPDGTWANAVSYGTLGHFFTGNGSAWIKDSRFKSNGVGLSLDIWTIGANIYGNTSGATANIVSANTTMTTDSLMIDYPIPYQILLDGLTVGGGAQYINQTATPTLNVDKLGHKPIVKGANNPLTPGDIGGPNHQMLLTYNTGLQKWVLQNPIFGIGTIGVQYANASGTSDALVANFEIPFRVLNDGLTIGVGGQYINQTTAPTLDVDGLGAYPIVKGANYPLVVGDIGGADHEMLLTFNLGTYTWVLQNPLYGVGTTGPQYRNSNDYQYFVANLTHTGTGSNIGGFDVEYMTVDPRTGSEYEVAGEELYQSPDGTWANATARGIMDIITTSGNTYTILIKNSTLTANGGTNFFPIWNLGQELIGNTTGARANLYAFDSTSTTDKLVTNFKTPFRALTDGLTIGLGGQYINQTPAPTLNVNGLGEFPMVKGAGYPLLAGDIGGQDHSMIVTFKSGIQSWVLQNPTFGVGAIGVQYTDATGTADALVANYDIPYKELFDGLTVGIGAQYVNQTTSPTLLLDGHGPYPIRKGANRSLLIGDIGGANHEMLLTYNSGTGTWVIQNPIYGVGSQGLQYNEADDYQRFKANLVVVGTGANTGGFNTQYSYFDASGAKVTIPGEIVFQSPDDTWANATAHGFMRTISSVSGEYHFILKNSMTGNGTVAGETNLLTIWNTNANIVGNTTGAKANLFYFDSITTTDTIQVDYSIPYGSLPDGLSIGVGAKYVNQTSTPTLAVDNNAPATIVKGTGSPLIAGDIGGQDHEMILTYNSRTDNWILQNPVFGVGTIGVQYWDAVDRGDIYSDQIILNYPIPYKELFDGLTVGMGVAYPNKTTTPTLSVDGHPAYVITRNTNAPLLPGDIGGHAHEILLTFNSGTNNWVIQNPINLYGPNAVVHSGQTSTSANTGALVVTGGAGISGNTNIGGKLSVADTAAITGATTLQSTLSVGGTTTANIINASGIVTITNGSDSNGTASGALVVNGGIGIAKTGYVGGDFHIMGNLYAANTISTSTTTTSVTNTLLYLGQANPAPYNFDVGVYSWAQDTFSGIVQYMGMARNHANDYWVFFSNANTSPTANTTINFTEANIIYDTIQAGGLLLQNTTVSTSTTTGALQVAGGVGIGGSLYAASVYTDNMRFANGVAYGSSTFAPSSDITASAPSGFNTSFSLTASGVAAGTYGTASLIPAITVDSKGRISAVTSNQVSTSVGVAGTTGTGSVAIPSGTLTFASSNGVTAIVSGSTVTLATPQDLQVAASPTFANVTATSALIGQELQVGAGVSTIDGSLILSNGVRVYAATATDGSTLHSDIRHNPSTGSLSISAKSGALYLNRENGTGGVVFSNGANGTVGMVDSSGNANFVGAITQNGNQVLHATNYTNYAPSKTGSGASGNWGINVTGSAGSVTGTAITGTTLAAGVVNSSLTSVGILSNLRVSGTSALTGTVNAGTFIASTVSAGTIGNVGTILNGTLNTAAQPNITSVGTLTGLSLSGAVSSTSTISASGTITGGAFSTAGTIGGGATSVTSLAVSGTSVLTGATTIHGTVTTGTIHAATIGNTGATLTGTVSTAAQPNITSVGTLTGLTVSGASSLAGVTASGAVSITNATASTSATTGALIVTGGVGVSGAINAAGAISTTGTGGASLNPSGDIYAYRSGGTTGVIFLNNTGTKYLYNDGTNYQLPGQGLVVGGAISAGGEVIAGGSTHAQGSFGYNATQGAIIMSKPGSLYDFSLINPANTAYIMRVPTGTNNVTFSGSVTTGALTAGATSVTTFTASGSSQIYSLGIGTAASGVAGQIRATNSITAYYSDKRLKTVTGKIENALDKIDQLAGILYTQNKLAEEFGYTDYSQQVGVFAQDVQKVLPEAVKPAPFDIAEDGSSKSGENYLTVQYEKIVPLLIEGIKELRAEINTLKGKQ